MTSLPIIVVTLNQWSQIFQKEGTSGLILYDTFTGPSFNTPSGGIDDPRVRALVNFSDGRVYIHEFTPTESVNESSLLSILNAQAADATIQRVDYLKY